MIGERIRQARLISNRTIAALSEAINIPYKTIQKFEKNIQTPSSIQLYKIAQACGVRMEYFFLTPIQLKGIEFCKHTKNFGKHNQKRIQSIVQNIATKRLNILNVFPEFPLTYYKSPDNIMSKISCVKDIDLVSQQLRDTWKLGINPIVNLTNLLEKHGIIVEFINKDKVPSFIGMKAIAVDKNNASYPVVVVAEQAPGDRQRFTLAHELGHIILENYVSSSNNIEKFCDYFAEAFLLPEEQIIRALGKKRKSIYIYELEQIKKDFGVSLQTIIIRSLQCKIISEKTYKQLMCLFSKNGCQKIEPGVQYQTEKSSLFKQLVYRARSENYISDSKAAEFLGISIIDLDALEIPSMK